MPQFSQLSQPHFHASPTSHFGFCPWAFGTPCTYERYAWILSRFSYTTMAGRATFDLTFLCRLRRGLTTDHRDKPHPGKNSQARRWWRLASDTLKSPSLDITSVFLTSHLPAQRSTLRAETPQDTFQGGQEILIIISLPSFWSAHVARLTILQG
jgi:hypothetical protein